MATFDEKLQFLKDKNSAFAPQEEPLDPAFGVAPDGSVAEKASDFRNSKEKETLQSIVRGDFEKRDPDGTLEGDPGFLERSKNFGASLMAAAFDYTDKKENVVEGAWDYAVVWPLMKMYERINQGGSYLGALAPGGIDPITWDEAGTISPGQVATLNAEIALSDPGKLDNFMNIVMTGSSIGGAGMIPLGMAYRYDGKLLPDNFEKDPKQFLNKERQEEVFGSGPAQFSSGAYDFTWAVVVDPLLLVPGGKIIKLARLRFLDEALKTGDDYTALQNTIADDMAKVVQNPEVVNRATPGLAPSSATKASELSGAGQDIAYVLTSDSVQFSTFVNTKGNQDLYFMVRSVKENPLTRNLPVEDQFKAAALIYRAQGLGDKRAIRALTDEFPGLTKLVAIATAVRRSNSLSPNNAASHKALTNSIDKLEAELEQSIRNLSLAPEGTRLQVSAAEDFKDVLRRFLDITGSENPMERAAQLGTLPLDNPQVARILGDVDEINAKAFKDIRDAAQGAEDLIRQVGSYNYGLTAETRIGRGNVLGRWNQARRLKNLDKTASIVPAAGNVRMAVSAASSTTIPIFSAGGMKMMMRLWRLPGVERPSGQINLRGLTGADNLREIQATIFSTRTFSGAARVVDNQSYGGAERGKEILDAWVDKYGGVQMDGQSGLRALEELEETITREVFFFTKPDDVVTTVEGVVIKAGDEATEAFIKQSLSNANNNRVKEVIKVQQGRSYWMDGDEVQHIPVSESSLADKMFTYDFRHFEDVLRRSNYNTMFRDKVNGLYNGFNDLWRPAVLFRLGYPVRNVGEGIIRASMYEMSFRPIVDAFKAGYDGSGNLLVRGGRGRRARKEDNIVSRLQEDQEAYLRAVESGDAPTYVGVAKSELEKDPAFIRASRDKKFRRWWLALTRKYEAELERAQQTVKDAEADLEEIKSSLPEGTLLEDVVEQTDAVRALPTDVKDAQNVKKVSLEGVPSLQERNSAKTNPVGQPGKFTDNSGYGIESARFLESGQVVLTRLRNSETKAPRQDIVVKTPGNLLVDRANRTVVDEPSPSPDPVPTQEQLNEDWAANPVQAKITRRFREIAYTEGVTGPKGSGKPRMVLPEEASYERPRQFQGQPSKDKDGNVRYGEGGEVIRKVGANYGTPISGMSENEARILLEFAERSSRDATLWDTKTRKMFERQAKELRRALDDMKPPPSRSLPGAKGYAFDPNRQFFINKITDDEIVFTSGGRTYTEPIEIVTSRRNDATLTKKLQDIVDGNNLEFTRRSASARAQASVDRLEELGQEGLLPQINAPMTARGDIDLEVLNRYRTALDNLEDARLLESAFKGRLAEIRLPDRAIRQYAQQRVRKHMSYQSEMAQDFGTGVVTALLKSSDREAFGDNRLASQAMSAASAKTTTRHHLSLDSRISESGVRRKLREEFVEIDPRSGDGSWIALSESKVRDERRSRYFQGNATQLRQMYNGVFGKEVMQAKTEVSVDGSLVFAPGEVDRLLRLFNTDEGRQIWEFLSSNPPKSGFKDQTRFGAPKAEVTGGRYSRVEPNSTQDLLNKEAYLNKVLKLYEDLTPNGQLRNDITSGRVVPNASESFSDTVLRLNGDPVVESRLKPLIGDVELDAGNLKRVGDLYREKVQKGFGIIGVLPEDAFVRMPFYGREYKRVFENRVELARQAAESEGRRLVSGAELGRIVTASHKDALRATKRYLYTIERRTWLGDNFEKIMPFISAGQNAVQAVGRLTTRDPSSAALVAFLWSRPYLSGDIVDENNEVSLPWMQHLLPKFMEKNFSDVGINLGSLNLLFPETGYGLVHRPGPVVTVPASEMMKRGLLLTPYAPQIMRNIIRDDEVSDEVWAQFQKYLFGERGGPFDNSVRALFPAGMQKAADLLFKGKAYSYALDTIMRQEIAAVQSGEREMPEGGIDGLWEEAAEQTNGYILVRMAFNYFSPTSPSFHPTIDPLVDEYRHYQKTYGKDADRYFNEAYGPALQYIGSKAGSRSIAGVDITDNAIRRAVKYSGLTEYIADDLVGEPNILGAIINDPDPKSEYVYSPSALRWQEAQKIPGLSDTYRDLQSPREALNASSVAAGWTEYLRFIDKINVVAAQSGLSSYSKSPELMAAVKEKKALMMSDPLYTGWGDAFRETGSSRLAKTLRIMEKITGNNVHAIQFQSDPDNEQLVNGMQEYLSQRKYMAELVRQTGLGIRAEDNAALFDAWVTYVDDLNMRNPTFNAFYQRFLYGDNRELQFPGVSYDTYNEEM